MVSGSSRPTAMAHRRVAGVPRGRRGRGGGQNVPARYPRGRCGRWPGHRADSI